MEQDTLAYWKKVNCGPYQQKVQNWGGILYVELESWKYLLKITELNCIMAKHLIILEIT